MEFLDLFVVSLNPVLKTLLITVVGLLLAIPRIDILGDVARHHLNNVVYYVFNPALTGGSLADTVTATSIVSLWFMPVNILLTFILGSGLGWALVKITRTPEDLHGLVVGSCAAGNHGHLLLIIIPAVCEEDNSPFGDKLTCSANGQGLVSLSMAINAIYIWTYVYNIIWKYGNLSGKDIAKASTISIDCSGRTLDMFRENYTEALLQSRQSSFNDCEDPDDEYSEVQEHNIAVEDVPEKKETLLTKIKAHLEALSDKINLKMWFTPTTNATATVPAMTLIVGANLLKGMKKSGVGVWLMIGILAVRYVALPIVGFGVVKAAQHVGFVGSDSLYVFILLIQYSVPPAMAIGTITQLFEVGESECSVIMLWTYGMAAIALTLWSTFFMRLVS
ncbi:protein PIN-LIKES 3 isoform X2 [Helianthus annuus]|uniref:protein PIN-LIKES 3 isoform X2 n=1 Tax=Helianthus annuus TaxID=4232 RepID=UPI001652D650|nr:protein PIN-LIKES 3 isoform X2 [Helianthus annuus]